MFSHGISGNRRLIQDSVCTEYLKLAIHKGNEHTAGKKQKLPVKCSETDPGTAQKKSFVVIKTMFRTCSLIDFQL